MCNDLVLIVDDSPDIRLMLAHSLKHNGKTVIEAATGPDAVAQAHRHRPALILMDINLPGLDGFEVARHMRADPALEDVPIIAMTAHATTWAATLAQQAGCQQILFKPFTLDVLSAAIAVLIPRNTAALAPCA